MIYYIDPIEYKLVVDVPDNLRLNPPSQIDDDKSSVSAFGDKRIQLVDNRNQVAGTYATMVHIEEDSLNGDDQSTVPQNAIVLPTYEKERSPRMQLKYDKFRPQDPNAVKFDKERKFMQA